MLTVSLENFVCRDCKKASRRAVVWFADEILKADTTCKNCGCTKLAIALYIGKLLDTLSLYSDLYSSCSRLTYHHCH